MNIQISKCKLNFVQLNSIVFVTIVPYRAHALLHSWRWWKKHCRLKRNQPETWDAKLPHKRTRAGPLVGGNQTLAARLVITFSHYFANAFLFDNMLSMSITLVTTKRSSRLIGSNKASLMLILCRLEE
ncbi:uncharacterized protein PHALS_07468 [Plasmopara halstedii]|uniref:Uncharacterized protein n=1 Tax=Plasmopara halstedii TaxID=4781 RepID=A0A0P1B4K9_PLAHL|nr:uncharacterized protein PHALS_07468 [Plasmopara halstedii]CEG49716.1 hypothetical protein PHALS_07468 [Plasmopara halstedii]|eukprot:XP_024586085.1 hypothetical protein PHALS_07468 [Plasmopara halstedii]